MQNKLQNDVITTMLKQKAVPMVHELPRLGVSAVFLWFGIDKFVLHDFYVSWFRATERIQALVPFDDPTTAVYVLGVVELILAAFFFSGKLQTLSGLLISITLIVIMSTARFPSSFPQDIALLAVAGLVAFAGRFQRPVRIEMMKKYSWILRIAIAVVLVLWATDHLVNQDRHIGWLSLSSGTFADLDLQVKRGVVNLIAMTELALAAGLVVPVRRLSLFAPVASVGFFVVAITILSPPPNNHQTLSMIFTSFWLAYVAKKKG